MAKKGRPSHREKVFNALPGTRAQIARKSGVSTASVGAWLAVFKAEGIAHIARWRVPRIGQRIPIYQACEAPGKPDMPRPAPFTGSESQKRFEERNPGRLAEIRAAYEQRQREVMAKRKQRLAAWALPLTVVVSKPQPAKNFPESVERDQV